MNGRVVVFGPWLDGDAALANSRWIALQHSKQLGDDCIALLNAEAVGPALEAAMDKPSIEGVTLCGHGDGGKAVFLLHNQNRLRDKTWQRLHDATSAQGAVFGADGKPALHAENVGRMATRWVHVLACDVGLSELPGLAVSRGAVAFAAYDQRLVPEFDVPSLPGLAAQILATIVTVTTRGLRDWEFNREVLARRVRMATEELLNWIHSEAGQAWSATTEGIEVVGLTIFATQLHSALRAWTSSSMS